MKGIWRTLLRLYPRAHREKFGDEMEAVFEQAAEERRGQGWRYFARFLIAEMFGVLRGAGAAWIAGGRGAIAIGMPNDAASAQALIEANLRRMERAVATHQFARARFFSCYDLQLRERLSQLRKT